MARLKYIFIHHSVTSQTKSTWKDIDNIHRNQRFPKSSLGYYVGYTYVIDYKGFIKQTRKDTETGAHTYVPGRDYNNEGIGICLLGNFDNDKPTEKQEAALSALIKTKMREHNIQRGMVKLHREMKATACPGRNVSQGYLTKILSRDNMATKLSDIKQDTLNKLIDMAGARWTGATKSRNNPEDKKAPWEAAYGAGTDIEKVIDILHKHKELGAKRVERYKALIELKNVQKELDACKSKKAEDMSALSKLEQIKVILGIK